MEFTLFGKGFHAFGGKNQAAVSEDGELYTRTERRKQFDPTLRPFLNASFGNQMNQDVTFSGTPEIIHNGGTSTEWTGTGPATWDFSTGDVVTLTAGNNADAATFSEETPTTVDMSGYTALTMAINLTTYTDVNHTLLASFDLAGVLQGNAVQLDDYIDTSMLGTAQNIVIPKADLGLASQSVDGFTITLVRLGGSKPTMTFDDIQLEQTGSPATFTVFSEVDEPFYATELRIVMADALTGVVTNGTMPGLSYNKILGVDALPNGIVFRRVTDGETGFAAAQKQLSDFIGAGSNIESAISDGTNTYITLVTIFPEPIILEGPPNDNFLAITINDDLSGLLLFNAVLRGGALVSDG